MQKEGAVSLQAAPALGRGLRRSPAPDVAIAADHRDVKRAVRERLAVRIDRENDLLAVQRGDAHGAAYSDATVLGVLERLLFISPLRHLADFQRPRGPRDLVLRGAVDAALGRLYAGTRPCLS